MKISPPFSLTIHPPPPTDSKEKIEKERSNPPDKDPKADLPVLKKPLGSHERPGQMDPPTQIKRKPLKIL